MGKKKKEQEVVDEFEFFRPSVLEPAFQFGFTPTYHYLFPQKGSNPRPQAGYAGEITHLWE